MSPIAPKAHETEYACTIQERGNGLPDVGDYVSDGDQLYRVESIDSRIQIGQPGESNWVYATVVAVDWSECSASDEHTASATIAVRNKVQS
jgi:hypothetical protein